MNNDNNHEQIITEWLAQQGYTHSLSLQLPFCIKSSNLDTTKRYLRQFMLDFEKGIIYKKCKQTTKRKTKDTNDWQRRMVDFVVFFENHKNSYTPYHCHILLEVRKRTGDLYTDEEINNALEYANEQFAKRLAKTNDYEPQKLMVEYDCRQITPDDNIYHYDIKEFISDNKITSIDRLEMAGALLGVTRHKRPIKQPSKQPEQETSVSEQPIVNLVKCVVEISKRLYHVKKTPLIKMLGCMCSLGTVFFERMRLRYGAQITNADDQTYQFGFSCQAMK